MSQLKNSKLVQSRKFYQFVIIIGLALGLCVIMLTNSLKEFSLMVNYDGSINFRHVFFGFVILSFIGYVSVNLHLSKRLRVLISLFLGFSAALTLNEFVISVNLADISYWLKTGNVSADALIIFSFILSLAFLISIIYEKTSVSNKPENNAIQN